jgi:CRP/FNR family cyclic AMP-dependent transcriptional regulator
MAEALHKVLYFLGTMDDQDIEWIVRNGRKRNVPTATRIIEEGESTDSLFFILSGEFRVTAGSGQHVLAYILPGEILGEISFVDSRPPSATVTATEDSEVGAVPVAKLKRKLEEDSSFAARFFKSMAVALADRLRAHRSLGGSSAAFKTSADNEMSPELLDIVSLAGERFAEMQRRPWGD